jgi:hypothetical protein
VSFVDRFRTHEGLIKPNGFSWDRTDYSRLVIYLRAYRAALRIRFKHDRRIPELAWFWSLRKKVCHGIEYDFLTQSIKVNGVCISLELLDAMTMPREGSWFSFRRVNNYVYVTEHRMDVA